MIMVAKVKDMRSGEVSSRGEERTGRKQAVCGNVGKKKVVI
jgi:hypothetical protein